MDSAYGSDKKPEFEDNPAAAPGSKLDRTFSKLSSDDFSLVPGPNLNRTFSKLSSDDISLSSCSDLSSVSTIKRPDSNNYDSVIRYFIEVFFNVTTTIKLSGISLKLFFIVTNYDKLNSYAGISLKFAYFNA